MAEPREADPGPGPGADDFKEAVRVLHEHLAVQFHQRVQALVESHRKVERLVSVCNCLANLRLAFSYSVEAIKEAQAMQEKVNFNELSRQWQYLETVPLRELDQCLRRHSDLDTSPWLAGFNARRQEMDQAIVEVRMKDLADRVLAFWREVVHAEQSARDQLTDFVREMVRTSVEA
jgi:hypothetical protein